MKATDPTATGDRRLDPRIARSREAILAAAADLFYADGYAHTSIEDIAARAGVAKRTVYNVFADKETLFRSLLTTSIDTATGFARRAADELEHAGTPEAARDALLTVGRRLAATVADGRIVPLRRLVITEASRFPDLAAQYYAAAPEPVMASLARSLERFHRLGWVHAPDPSRAAEHFAFLVLGLTLDSALFDPEGRAGDPEEIDHRAVDGVHAFLRAYAPHPA
ncbi:TetR/AcrR family transcriptional regulator [Nocardiopsis sp. N85]|uniref:TetR/AcrR family transcriptional regulator n=1 Tax=Nocardiopsis sp. N85 TaxID=3029400 RepID=UPI00237F8D51|nr:TetR/AcrR family transcriptional regulator [Nocardiopsis sp. N85]MDE3725108.1 TetR/AcrR family transcriptional regulator [Nocardiopsis sp. N85]